MNTCGPLSHEFLFCLGKVTVKSKSLKLVDRRGLPTCARHVLLETQRKICVQYPIVFSHLEYYPISILFTCPMSICLSLLNPRAEVSVFSWSSIGSTLSIRLVAMKPPAAPSKPKMPEPMRPKEVQENLKNRLPWRRLERHIVYLETTETRLHQLIMRVT